MAKPVKALSLITPINFGIFSGSISFACGYKISEMVEFYKTQGCADWAGGLRGVSFSNDCSGMALTRVYKKTHLFYLILKEPFSFTDDEYVTLAHECIHLVQFRLRFVLDRDREYECEAYLHTHLMTQCLKALRGES